MRIYILYYIYFEHKELIIHMVYSAFVLVITMRFYLHAASASHFIILSFESNYSISSKESIVHIIYIYLVLILLVT